MVDEVGAGGDSGIGRVVEEKGVRGEECNLGLQ